jgi:hypothetical protein
LGDMGHCRIVAGGEPNAKPVVLDARGHRVPPPLPVAPEAAVALPAALF